MPTITVLAGDGIGPEIVAEAVKALDVVADRFDIDLDIKEALVGGAAYDATGHPLPPETLELCKVSDAVLLGAVGGPKYDTIELPELRPGARRAITAAEASGAFRESAPCRSFACAGIGIVPAGGPGGAGAGYSGCARTDRWTVLRPAQVE